jgi:hypothetical protein
VDNPTGNVDGEAAESFSTLQAVDGISAGSEGSGTLIVRHCPHLYPQLARCSIGVSAQSLHRLVYTAIGRLGRVGTRLS